MKRSEENVKLIQDVLMTIERWGYEAGAMDERAYETPGLIDLIEKRYGVRCPKPEKTTKPKKAKKP